MDLLRPQHWRWRLNWRRVSVPQGVSAEAAHAATLPDGNVVFVVFDSLAHPTPARARAPGLAWGAPVFTSTMAAKRWVAEQVGATPEGDL